MPGCKHLRLQQIRELVLDRRLSPGWRTQEERRADEGTRDEERERDQPVSLHRTACGTRLGRQTIGVAHRHLPCGTRVTLKHRGRYVRARVIDRGPYTRGVRWDLTQQTARKLHLTTTDTIRAAPIN